jgi:hypothetical protein
MSDVDTLDAPVLLADPLPSGAQPLMMTDTYVEINGVNLKCLSLSVSLEADNNPISQTTFCGVQEYPGPVKYHFVAKLAQSFDPGGTDATLSAAVTAYAASGTLAAFKVRPYGSRPVAANNPEFSGFLIPLPYTVFGGDAGNASEVDIDWTATGPWTKNTGAVAATGATAGSPGQFTPAGATRPANLAALAAVAATPNTAWTAGQYVITADQLGAHWDGAAWAAGVA